MLAQGSSKSSKTQSTLFQTWGYQGNIQTSSNLPQAVTNAKQKCKTQKEKIKSIKTRPTKETNQLWTVTSKHDVQKTENQPVSSEALLIDNLNNDDEDEALSEAVCQVENEDRCYVEKIFNPSSPESLPGFDRVAGESYIYPINYPVRDYQFNIITKALVKNTLVVLPTGLGKTFIAAVVMYNFYRWYPRGKILFMAPTKPLVAQQIEACCKITGIPFEDTAEMTGSLQPQKRKMLWETKRVFFLTPHILQNDIGRGACFANDVVCLVFDEAHKALGNYAYCQVIKEVAGCKSDFRVLALSATPGDDMKAVQTVLENLLISHIELRSEESPDIKRYVFDRNVEKIVVPLSDELKKTKSQFQQVLQGVIQRLYSNGACWQSDASKVSKFLLLKTREQFRERGMEDKTRAGTIEGDFALAISLYHAFELLQQHGILSFYNFLKEICSGKKGTARARGELMRHERFTEMMQDLQQKIEGVDNLDDSSLNASTSGVLTPKRRLLKSIPKTTASLSSHPKLNKLEEIVVGHFETAAKENLVVDTAASNASQTPLNTRVMIFSQYRDSVQEITAILNRHRPLVKVMSFVGQNGSAKGKKGLTQKEQLEVVERFRKGGYNVLVSTSVGEEGLDIGDVDLIICFDASNSPIRLVQRMGRTGRKRAGKIVILVTEGKEEQIYKRSVSSKNSIHKKLINAANSLVLYDQSPRMIPKHMNPYCLKMQITINPDDCKSRGTKRKSSDRKLEKKSARKCNKEGANTIAKTFRNCTSYLLSPDEEQYWRDNFRIVPCNHKAAGHQLGGGFECDYPTAKLSEWTQWQSLAQPVGYATHSTKTYAFCELIEQFDAIRDKGSSYANALKGHYDDNSFISKSCSKKNRDRKKGECRKRKERSPTGDRGVDGKKVKGGKKTKKQMKLNSARTWRKRTVIQNKDFDVAEEDDDDFVTVKKVLAEESIACNVNDDGYDVRDARGSVEVDDRVGFEENNNEDKESAADKVDSCDNFNCSINCDDLREKDEFHRVGEPKSPEHDKPAVMGSSTVRCDMERQDTSLSDGNLINGKDDEGFGVSSQLDTSPCFPSSTPDSSIQKLMKHKVPGSSEFKFRRRMNPGCSVVPSPPKLSDLSFLSFGNLSDSEMLDEKKSNCLIDNGRYQVMESENCLVLENDGSFAKNASRDKFSLCSRLKKSLEFGRDGGNYEDSDLNGGVEVGDTNMEGGVFEMKDDMLDDLETKLPGEWDKLPEIKTEVERETTVLNRNKELLKRNNELSEIKEEQNEIKELCEGKKEISEKETYSHDSHSTRQIYERLGNRDVIDQKVASEKNIVEEPRDKSIENVKLEDISNIDFGDSLFDVGELEDFDDCPASPPVVASLPSASSEDAMKQLELGSPKYEIPASTKTALQVSASKNPDVTEFDLTVGNSEDILRSSTVDTLDCKALTIGVVDRELSLRNEADDFESRNDELFGESQNPVLSLVSRLRNRNVPGIDNLVGREIALSVSPMKKDAKMGESNMKEVITDRNSSDDSPVCRVNNRKAWHRSVVSESCRTDSGEEESPLNLRRRRKTKRRCVLDETVAPDSDQCDDDKSVARLSSSKHRIKMTSSSDNGTCRDSDDDFDYDSSLIVVPKGKQLNKGSSNNKPGMNKQKRNKRIKSDFIEMEAEVTDDMSGDEDISMNDNAYVMDSFIDDRSELTQPTPVKDTPRGGHNSRVDMSMIYRQSLFSPLYGALNFRTPGFRADQNRYKMVGRGAWHEPSDGEDEAIEVNDFIVDDDFEEDFGESIECEFLAEDEITDGYGVTEEDDVVAADEVQVFDDFSDSDSHSSDLRRTGKSSRQSHTTNCDKFPLPPPVDRYTTDRLCRDNKTTLEEKPTSSNANFVVDNSINVSCDDFVPCFDLGLLDYRKLDKNMIESAWKEISSEGPSAKSKPVHFATPKAPVSAHKQTPTVFAHSKAVSICQVGTHLRLKHHLAVVVCSRLACDFTVNKRMGILRRLHSDISNGANSLKNTILIREMCDSYADRCLIIEKDRVKGSSVNEKAISYTKYYCRLLGYLAELKIKVLFSDSQEETASLIAKLASKERDGKNVPYSGAFSKPTGKIMEQMLTVLLTIPYLTYPLALEICYKYKNFAAFTRSNPDELTAKIPQVSRKKAKEIIEFFKHKVSLL
eukprot:gene20486-22502_t